MAVCGIALKEWALVVAAMERGLQTLLLRKGGIHEGRAGFEIKHSEFWLYPTFDHQSLEFVRPEFHSELADSLTPTLGPTEIEFPVFARVERISLLEDAEGMTGLESRHVYTKAFIEKRLAYKPERPLYLCHVQAYRPEPAPRIEFLRRYAGCVSWVELERPLPLGRVIPVEAE